jgi:hypothetical protein
VFASLVATALLLHLRRPQVVASPVVVTVPAPVIMPAVPAPPEPPPPPPPAPRVEPPVTGTTCVADVATVGVPIGQRELAEVSSPHGPLRGGAVDATGCVLAVWHPGALVVSWDGGQTFSQFDIDGTIDAVAPTTGRVAILRDRNSLGVVHAGDAKILWRDIGVLASPDEGPGLGLSAAGRYTLISRGEAPLLGITDSDGATWRFVTPPAADEFRITAAGRIWATQTIVHADGDTGATVEDHRHMMDLGDARWRHDGAIPFDPGEPAWTYALRQDEFWGCGGTEKLVAFHHGRAVATVASKLSRNVFRIELAGNAIAGFGRYDDHLHRLRGARSSDLGELPAGDDDRLIGVDRYGTPVFIDGAHVLRWSERGGWRILWTVPDLGAD